jgi:hypothetical protein
MKPLDVKKKKKRRKGNSLRQDRDRCKELSNRQSNLKLPPIRGGNFSLD